MPKRNKQTIEAIRLFELEEGMLTDKQMEIRERYQKAFHYLFTFRQIGQVVKKIQDDFGVSLYTAYDDVNAAMELYGDPIASNKAALRYINTENQSRMLQLLELEIKRKKDVGLDIAEEIETHSKISMRIARINRLHEADEEVFDPSRFERSQVFVVNLNPDVMQKYGDVVDLPLHTVKLPA